MSTTERTTAPSDEVARGIPPSNPRPRRRVGRVVVLSVLLTVVALTITALGIASAWGAQLREEQRLLPGTSVAGIDVGGRSTAEAADLVASALADSLDAPVTLLHGTTEWTVTPRELGASADTEAVLAAAFARTEAADLWELTRLRWLGPDSTGDLDVTITLPEDTPASYVTALAAEIDHDPTDAVVEWGDGGPTVTPHATGESLDVVAAAASLRDALEARGGELTLPVATVEPAVPTEVVTAAGDAAIAAIDAALDRPIPLRLGERSWTTTPRALGAVADGASVLEAALTAEVRTLATVAAASLPVELRYPDGALTAYVATIASEVDVAPVNATGTWRGDRMDITPERDGLALNRDDAVAALSAALRGEAEQVQLTTRTTTASVTAASFQRVLYLDQSARTLQLREGDRVVREWPVAVGTNNSPTPTGTFVIGAKRFEPTWTNPAPTRWGRDMPARIGPGPDNPLGPRALNWNRIGGGDTLIRFHGTPNEDSIGQAASNGCVRMYNQDVIELFDLVPSGTTVISAP
jgi:lipoprotein-anchoring transpeptidase ErfK/SrfK